MGYQGETDGGGVTRLSLIKSLKNYFSPEFLNRVDEIVVFNHLDQDGVKKIIDIQLEGTREYLEKQEKELIIKDEVIDHVIKTGYSKEYGARNISRALKGEVLEKIAKVSLEKDWEYAKYVVCSLYKDEVEVGLEPAGAAPLTDEELMEQSHSLGEG